MPGLEADPSDIGRSAFVSFGRAAASVVIKCPLRRIEEHNLRCGGRAPTLLQVQLAVAVSTLMSRGLRKAKGAW
jgi:hypothetical protein